MPETPVVFFRSEDGAVPVLDEIERVLKRGDPRLATKFRVKIDRLAQQGHELRRPEADYLADGIHELRVVHRRVYHRVLYFFSDRTAVLSHTMRKEGRVPRTEIERAARHRSRYTRDPHRHTHAI